jgi:hypothetical protein
LHCLVVVRLGKLEPEVNITVRVDMGRGVRRNAVVRRAAKCSPARTLSLLRLSGASFSTMTSVAHHSVWGDMAITNPPVGSSLDMPTLVELTSELRRYPIGDVPQFTRASSSSSS